VLAAGRAPRRALRRLTRRNVFRDEDSPALFHFLRGQTRKKMADRWVSQAKHYCEICRCWTQGDKQVRQARGRGREPSAACSRSSALGLVAAAFPKTPSSP
jgi:hypothetical protein